MQRQLILVLGLVVLPGLCLAQGGGSWWRQLFKPKQEAPNSEVLPVSDGLDSVDPVSQGAEVEPLHLDTAAEENGGLALEDNVDRAAGIAGRAIWHIPDAISALDSGRVEPNAIRIPGYRVQLFMGKLDTARSLKRSLEAADSTLLVHLTPYPPLFGVTLGNFTKALSAHRVREAWRGRFPNALVVPLDLSLDALYPEVGSAPYGPQMTPTNRD